MMELTQQNLETQCTYWQGILRLQDWDIQLTIKRMKDMGDRQMGSCVVVESMREARLDILDPRDYDAQAFIFKDAWTWEITLIHELLHLHLNDCDIEWKGAAGTAGERAIDHIAKALYKLRVLP